jgi:Tfp pilus assembly protein PilN
MRPINLLPPDVALKAAGRRRRALWVVAGISYLALLVVATLWWQTRVNDKEDELEDQQAVNQSIQAEAATFSGAIELQELYNDNVLAVQSVLLTDANWGRLLNDVGRLIPDRTWLTDFNGLAALDFDTGTFGTVTVNGVAFDYPDVSAWLRAFSEDFFPAGTAVCVPTASEAEIGLARTVDFSSSLALTEAALSTRAGDRIPLVLP